LPIQGTLFFQQAPKQKSPLKPLTSMSADDHLRKQAHLQRDHLQKMIIGLKILTRPSNTSLISFRNAVAWVWTWSFPCAAISHYFLLLLHRTWFKVYQNLHFHCCWSQICSGCDCFTSSSSSSLQVCANYGISCKA
jgi:hypothetical protein